MKQSFKTLSFSEITKLAKTNPEQANLEIKEFVTEKFNLGVVKVQINNSAVSLNSVNGYLCTETDEKLFFKFHAEEGETNTQSEYYNGKVLADNGFAIIEPLYQSTAVGEQFLIYPYITDPTFFEVCEALDEQFLRDGRSKQAQKAAVLQAEKKLCQQSAAIAKKTFETVSSDTLAAEPIWQLFSTRLVPKNNEVPRVDLYYTDNTVQLPDNTAMTFTELSQKTWIINGRRFDETLAQLIENAKKIVNANYYDTWGSIVAHGDDHNGNKFFDETSQTLMYFDPAFAGRNVPALLAFIKTIFHDTFAHPFWLYRPEKVDPMIDLEWQIDQTTVTLNHHWALSPLRNDLLKIKLEYLLKPTLQLLRDKDLLPSDAKTFIKKALFCCPFLVLNLINYQKFSPKMSLLALSKAVEMGSFADKDDYLDQFLRKNL